MTQVLDEFTLLTADNFCGAGGGTSALLAACADLGLRVEVDACNHWDTAIETHTRNHPNVRHWCENLDSVWPRKIIPGGKLHFAIFAPECFPAGTLILTREGLKPIEKITTDDYVLTHRGRYRRVHATSFSVKPTITIRGHGHPGLETTANHPFYAVEARQPAHAVKWMPAQGMVGHLWATPTVFESVPMPEPQVKQSGKGCRAAKGLGGYDEAFWWMIGRWLGDGSITFRRRSVDISICCSFEEATDLKARLDECNWPLNWTCRDLRTATLFECRHLALGQWLVENFGRRAEGKTIPAWALTLPRVAREALLSGYISADGWEDSRKIEVCTCSKKLAVGIRLLAESLGHRVAMHSRLGRASSAIEGRAIRERDQFHLTWLKNPQRIIGHQTELHSWLPVKEVTDNGHEQAVFNLSVAEDESYIADGIVVHNCIHHTKARGAKPMNDQSRATAWCVVRWCEDLDIENVLVENVEEFLDWGPLHPDDHPDEKLRGRPIKEEKGKFFRHWVQALRIRGYSVSWKVLNAAHYGAATSRKRLFVQARKNARITWPKPTHSDKPFETRGNATSAKSKLKPLRPARDIIDWKLEGTSIFGRKKPLSPNTLRRILAGLDKFCGLPFVIGQQSGAAPRSVTEPVPTIATAGAISLVQPFLVVLRNNCDALSMDVPLPTLCASGNHIAVAEPFLMQIEHATAESGDARRCKSLDAPIPTLTTKASWGLTQPFLVPVTHGGGENRCYDLDKPVPTITGAHRGEVALIESFLLPNEGFYRGNAPRSVEDPLSTITSRGAGVLIESFIVPQHSSNEALSLDKPVPTIMTDGGHALVNPFIVPFYSEREGQTPRCCSLQDPLDTVTGESRFALAQPYLVSFQGNDDAASLDRPLGTVTTRDRFALVQPEWIEALQIDKGQIIGRLDVRFRMLQPNELSAAMGFHAGYDFAGNKGEIVKQIGNAIEFNVMRALCLEMLKGYAKRKPQVLAEAVSL